MGAENLTQEELVRLVTAYGAIRYPLIREDLLLLIEQTSEQAQAEPHV